MKRNHKPNNFRPALSRIEMAPAHLEREERARQWIKRNGPCRFDSSSILKREFDGETYQTFFVFWNQGEKRFGSFWTKIRPDGRVKAYGMGRE